MIRKQNTYFPLFSYVFGTGDANCILQISLSSGRAIVKTVLQNAGKSQESLRTQAAAGSRLQHEQRTALMAHPATIARPLQSRQRLEGAQRMYPIIPRTSGLASWPESSASRCHEVEGNARNLQKVLEFCAVVQEPAVNPTLPTPKILSAIKQIRRLDPPETFLGGGAPSSPTSLRSRRTIPPHNGKSALVCLDAFGSPRGNWRG